MALVNFKKGTQSDYEGNVSTYANYLYIAEDTRNVYLFGVLQQGISDDIYSKLTAFDTSVLAVVNSQKNVANGIAGLDANGKIDPSLVDGVVGHVLGLEQFVTENPTAGADQVGKYYYNSTSKKIIEGIGNGSDVAYSWEETDPQAQVLYNRRGADDQGRTNVLYRWDGAAMTEVSPSIVLGEVTGTAYDGGKGKANRDALNSLSAKVITGFGAVTPNGTQITIAFTDADKNSGNNQYAAGTGGNIVLPAATGTAAGLMSAADKAKVNKIIDTGNGTQFLANDGTYKVVSMNLSDDYAASTLVNEQLAPAAGDSYETAIGKLHKAILDNEEVTAAAFVNFQTVLGVKNPNQVLPDLSSTNYLSESTTFLACLQALDTALKTVADQAATISDLTSRVTALETALTLKTV